jgi:hypothetical protein
MLKTNYYHHTSATMSSMSSARFYDEWDSSEGPLMGLEWTRVGLEWGSSGARVGGLEWDSSGIRVGLEWDSRVTGWDSSEDSSGTRVSDEQKKNSSRTRVGLE